MKYYVNDYYFSCIDSEEKAYFIGLLMSDGAILKGSHTSEYIRVSLHLSQTDIDILTKFRDCVESNHTIFIGKKFNDCALRFVSKPMVSDLAKYGIVPLKTGREKLILDEIPVELHRHVFRGLIDGDGWISKGYSNATLHDIQSVGICGSQEICQQFTLAMHQALHVGLLTPSKVKNKDCYKLQYSSYADVCEVVHYLYSNSSIYMDRKYARAAEICAL